MVFVKLLTCQ